jgi:hypothetical protein
MDADRADTVVRKDGIGDSEFVQTCARKTIERFVHEGLDFHARGNESLDASHLREDSIGRALARFDVQVGCLEFAATLE